MELISLGRQSVYPRIYLASYRGTSLAMETMRRSSNRNSVNDVNTASAFSSSGASGRRTLGFRKQERQLRTGSTGGRLRSIAQRTRSGACSYWIVKIAFIL